MQIAEFFALILPSNDEVLLLSVQAMKTIYFGPIQYQVAHCYYGHVAQFKMISDISYIKVNSVVLIKSAPAHR